VPTSRRSISGTYKVLTLFIDSASDIITKASTPLYDDEKPPPSDHAVSSVSSITLNSHFHNLASATNNPLSLRRFELTGWSSWTVGSGGLGGA
jgi:hypothetical protein